MGMNTFQKMMGWGGLATLSFGLMVACSNPHKTDGPNPGDPVLTSSDNKDMDPVMSLAANTFGALPESIDNPNNPHSNEKVELGRMLYFDTRLSKDGNISCNSCHNLQTFGVDNLPVSPGDAGENGERNSPTVFNAAFHMAQFWDGRAADVEEQAGGPILNPVEMAMPDKEAVIARLSKVEGYQTAFASAFPEQDKPITYDNLQNAIGAFERKLITPSKFDKFANGDASALNDQEKKGLQTFVDVGCNSCHNGALFGGNSYQKFGVYGDYWMFTNGSDKDMGRFAVTNNEVDKHMFKVPSLRNIAMTGPYFHDGSVTDLSEAVRVMGKAQLNKDLSDEQVNDIVAFLDALTGDAPQELTEAPELP